MDHFESIFKHYQIQIPRAPLIFIRKSIIYYTFHSIICRKLTHQRIIFPAYYRVKGIIYDALPFKDQRGSWNLDLIMFEDGLKVVHSKLQESKSGWPESNDSKQPRQFNFGWSLNIFLSADLTEITKLQLFVSKIELHKELDEGIVQKINQYIKEGEITDDM